MNFERRCPRKHIGPFVWHTCAQIALIGFASSVNFVIYYITGSVVSLVIMFGGGVVMFFIARHGHRMHAKHHKEMGYVSTPRNCKHGSFTIYRELGYYECDQCHKKMRLK